MADELELAALLDEEVDGDAVNLQIEGDEELLPSEESQPVTTTSELPSAVTSTSEPENGTREEGEEEAGKTEDQRSEEDDSLLASGLLPSRTGVIPRRYVNERGNFITGVDVTSEEAAAKRLQRAQRFGLSRPEPENFDKLHERGKRFGVQTPVVDGELIKAVKKVPEIKDGEVRPEAIYLHGTNDMNTNDVFQYFRDYGPSCVEWIDDSSCNVIWEDPTSASRALMGKGKNPVVTQSEREELFATSEVAQPTWRLGDPHLKSKQLLLRYANTGDIKERGAASRSKFYMKYGNPNQPLQGQERRRSGRKRSKGGDLRNKIKSKRAAASDGDDDHATDIAADKDNAGEKDSQGEEEEDMETEDKELSLMSYSKRAKTLYSDKGKKGGSISERVGSKTEPGGTMETNATPTGNDLRQKLVAKRKRTSLTIQQLDDGSRQVSMDTS